MKRQRLVIGVIAAAVALTLVGCSGGSGAPATKSSTNATGGTLTIGASVDATDWDTANGEVGNRIQYLQPVYDSLLHLDSTMKIQPWLAKSWTYNSANTELTLKLRDDVKFSDGQKFDADSAKASILHIQTGTGQNSVTVKSIASIDVVGAYELKLTLNAPDPALLRNLALVGGMQASPAAITAGTLKTTPAGSGPYVLDTADTVKGSQYVYKRNSSYWNEKAFPYDEIVIKPYVDLTARLNALTSGQTDAALIDSKSTAQAKGSSLTVQTSQGDWQGLFLIDRNGTQVPALKDVRVRQAINYAINRSAILKNVRLGQGTTTTQVFNPTSLAYDKSLDKAYPYNPKKAKQLLAAAGYADGFTITMPDVITDVDPIVVQELADVGIKVNLQQVSPNSAISDLLSGKYPAYVFSWGSSNAWQDIIKIVAPTAPWNSLKSSTPELDALLKKAQSSNSAADFQAVSSYLVKNAWFAPFYVQNNIYASDSKVKVSPQPQNVVPYIWDYAPAS